MENVTPNTVGTLLNLPTNLTEYYLLNIFNITWENKVPKLTIFSLEYDMRNI